MDKARFRTTSTALVSSMCLLGPGGSSAADTITFDPGPPDQRPHYSCLGAPRYLVMCAAKWMQLVHEGKPTKSRATYWYAAEFQGFVDGVAHATIGQQWCPDIIESNDQVYTIVAEYLVARQDRIPGDRAAMKLVIAALSTRAPCKH